MGGAAIAANLPCGMWREHTRKFSPQWFLAVHATIPFVASLRKAVLMPKWAILLTIAGSSERRRGLGGAEEAGWGGRCRPAPAPGHHAASAHCLPASCDAPVPSAPHLRLRLTLAPAPPPPSHLPTAVAGQNVGARLEWERLRQLAAHRQQAGASGSGSSTPPPPAADCVLPGLDASCRRCVQAAQSAIAWTLAPTVVP